MQRDEDPEGPGRPMAIRMLVGDPGFVYSRPCFSPTGDRVLYMRAPATDDPVAAANSDASPWSLWTVPVGGGEPTLLFDDPTLAATRPDWSWATGRIAFTGIRDGEAGLWLLGERGDAERVPVGSPPLTRLHYPSWYPDGTRIAVTDYASRQVLEVDLRGPSVRPITDPARVLAGMCSVRPGPGAEPAIAFAGQAPGAVHDLWRNAIWVKPPNGEARALDGEPGRMPAWSPDGTRLAFTSVRGAVRRRLMGERSRLLVQRFGRGLDDPLTPRPASPWWRSAAHPKWSPDGRRIACMLDAQWRGREGIAIIELPPEHQSSPSRINSL